LDESPHSTDLFALPNGLRFCCGACRSRRRPSSNIPCGGWGAYALAAASAC